jgi:transcriptional regulator with XRE-family HTH domain
MGDARAEKASQRFGRKVRAERQARGWTQAQLADTLGALEVPWFQSTVNKVETGLRSVSWDEALVLSAVLGFPLADAAMTDEQHLLEQAARIQDEMRHLQERQWELQREHAEVDAALYEIKHPGDTKAFVEAMRADPEATKRAYDALTEGAEAAASKRPAPARKTTKKAATKKAATKRAATRKGR